MCIDVHKEKQDTRHTKIKTDLATAADCIVLNMYVCQTSCKGKFMSCLSFKTKSTLACRLLYDQDIHSVLRLHSERIWTKEYTLQNRISRIAYKIAALSGPGLAWLTRDHSNAWGILCVYHKYRCVTVWADWFLARLLSQRTFFFYYSMYKFHK